MDKKDFLILILLFSVISGFVIAEPKFIVEHSDSSDNFWVNGTGDVYMAGDLDCTDCINPEDVNDIDDAQIETDLNTYVDIAGDTVTGDLQMNDNVNITWGSDNDVDFYFNGTCLIGKGPTSSLELC